MTEKLRPHQVKASKHLCEVLLRSGAALDGSDTGTGKTYTAVASIGTLGLPTLVIAPKISKTSWLRVGEHLGVKFSIEGWEKVRAGTSPAGRWQFPMPKARPVYYHCLKCFAKFKDPFNCSPCPNQFHGIHCVEAKHPKHNYGQFRWHPGIRLIVFDEAHRANATDSLQAEMLVAAKRQDIDVLCLTATPACSPLHFRGLGYLMGMHSLDGPDGFYAWSRRFGCGRHPVFKGWHWLAKKADRPFMMQKIHNQLFPRSGVRVRYQDIPGFPERIIEPTLFDLGGPEKINKLYDEMRESMAELKGRAAQDKDPDSPLTKLLRVRQEIELLKVPILVERSRDLIEQGKSVAIFCNYKQTITELSRRLKCDDIIDGDRKDRQEVIDRYQRDDIFLVLVNSQAGGICVSLHDILGQRGRAGLVMPDADVVKMRQVFGRLHRDSGKSVAYYQLVLAAGTKEEQVYRKFKAKSNDLDALLDSDFVPDDCV